MDCARVAHGLSNGVYRPCPANDCNPVNATVTITFNTGRRETHTGFVDPFSPLARASNLSLTGNAAALAADAFAAGMEEGGFVTGLYMTFAALEFLSAFMPAGDYNPQQQRQSGARDVGPIMKKINWFNSGNDYAAEKPQYQDMIWMRIFHMLSKSCADAFRRAKLPTPEEIINNGLTIAARPVLDNSSHNAALGISEDIRRKANESQAPVQTIRPQYTTKGAIILFRAEAFTDKAYLDENIAHEFIHAAGVGPHPARGYALGRGHDLSGYEPYTDIIKHCGYQDVMK